MEDNLPYALMRVQLGAPGPRRDYGHPAVRPVLGFAANLIVVAGTQKAVGRNYVTNLFGTLLAQAGWPYAIAEVNALSSAGTRAHARAGAKCVLVNPLEPGWYIRLLEFIDEHAGKVVIVTVPATFRRVFVDAEEAMMRHVAGLRGIGFAFVASEPTAALAYKHLEWLTATGLPQVPHRLVVRGKALVNIPDWTPAHQVVTSMLMPFVEEQLRDAMGNAAKPATFHAAWAGATGGTQSAMTKGVNAAGRDFGVFVDEITSSKDRVAALFGTGRP